MAQRNSSAGQAAAPCMAVPALGRKFWTITSWTCPWRRCDSAMAASASNRSARFSPMPTRIPVVKAISNAPAASKVANRRTGVLSGAPRWHSRSPRSDSIIIPCDAETARSAARSPEDRAPALAWGSNPVSSRTRRHMATR